MLAYQDVVTAHQRIRKYIHKTPVVTCRALDDLVGYQVSLKVEGLQRGGSFKVRGSTNAALTLSEEERKRGIISHSSGNHAQGVALAAQTVGSTALIVMPSDAPIPKREAVLGYGGEIYPYDRRSGDRAAIAYKLADETGRVMLPPFDDERIMAGQGTVALEFLDQVSALDAILVPIGGGGLISGCATVIKHLKPACRVFGIEPEAADDARQSLEKGERVTIAEPDTIADGLRPHSLGVKPFEVIRERVDQILTVTDVAIARALLFLFQRAKLVVEPSGCVGVAALMSGAVPMPASSKIGVVLSGGNLDPALMPLFLRIAEEGADRP
ncbi:MAG: threonine/serine dehydratase [Candidatus Eisenbacteria bacterium]|uniref:Threonine/serine dehydratase n=1 Tax=Eiseniibacteriota bacterium TaxID=2212470 RepID=A0A948WBX7_UNCEI|nr:threonine/serine dehydratase [Candidatus Eisenbacteria bacterium]MBU2690398.1 threonine/serine dehydratase [Candidatus Eisenbacteria bacterium]